MKNRIFALVFTLILIFSMVVPAYAADSYVYDDTGILSGSEIDTIEGFCEQIKSEYDFDILFAFSRGCDGMSANEFSEYFYEENAGSDGVALTCDVENNMYGCYAFGTGEEIFTDDVQDILWQIFDDADTWYDGVINLVTAAGSYVGSYYTDGAVTPIDTISAPVIPDTRQLDLLVDNADLLTPDEEAALLSKLEEISSRQKMDVAIVTVTSTDWKTPEAYADDFYDYNGYGQGPNKDGVLLLISMEDRDWHITTTGAGINAFTDNGMDYLMDGCGVLSLLGSNNYAGAFNLFADKCDEFITLYHEGNPVTSAPWSTTTYLIVFVVCLVIALIITKIILGIQTSNLKSISSQRDATHYVIPGTLSLTGGSDVFLYRNIAKTAIPKSSGSSGSRTHVSSSGMSHGGRGGKF